MESTIINSYEIQVAVGTWIHLDTPQDVFTNARNMRALGVDMRGRIISLDFTGPFRIRNFSPYPISINGYSAPGGGIWINSGQTRIKYKNKEYLITPPNRDGYYN